MDQNLHIHFIGIGGTGLSAIARVLLERGYTVSGSDMTPSPLAEDIASAGAKVFIGHDASYIQGADLILQSSAIPPTNPELQAALAQGIPVYKRSEFLGTMMHGQNCYGVAGTHGKTTTTSMLAWMLTDLGEDPSYIIGGVSKNLKNNAYHGKGKAFVIEADEYDNMFLGLEPVLAIITNMQHDHPDCFPAMKDYRDAFIKFIQRIRQNGTLFLCADEPNAFSLKPDVPPHVTTYTYGFSPDADYCIHDLHREADACFAFDITYHGNDLHTLRLQVPGEHNAQNACAVFAAAHQLGLDLQQAAAALHAFSGSERRFDVRGTVQGVTIIDDYAHHPTEIAATLHAARLRYPRNRICCVWQPHTYSRTITLMDDFIHCFTDADCVLVTEVYAAREKNDDFSSRTVADQIDHDDVVFTPSLQDAEQYLKENSLAGDVIIICSAGTAIEISEHLYAYWREKEQENG